ncbi:MAG: YbbR-like domain-containing protein [Vicinamibacteria bacterium]|nr:YbbR-like domain-containing protein [Vicinamibacteria bacterium]
MTTPRILLDHFGLKLISLALAVFFWSVIAGEKTLEVGFVVPLELQNVPPSVEIVSGAPDTIEVRVRAAAAIIRLINVDDLAVRLDISNVTPGERIFHLTDAIVRRPFGVSVVRLSPAVLTLMLDHTERKTVPISVRTTGGVADGFEAIDAACDPGKIVVAGPRSRLVKLTSAYTETVSIADAKEDVVKKVSVGIDEPLARIDGDPNVTATIRVREKEATRVFEKTPVEARGGSSRMRPGAVRIVIAGPVSSVEGVDDKAVRAFVDAREVGSPVQARVEIEIAGERPSIAVRSIEPEFVTLIPDQK